MSSTQSESHPTSPLERLQRPLFLWSLPYTFLYFTLPIISKGFGASALEVGGLFTIFTVTTLLLRPLVGWMLDRYGRKKFFVFALVVYSFSMGVFAFASSMNWLLAARFIQGIGSAFLWAAINTMVADLTPAGERSEALGKVMEVTARGGLLGIFAAWLPMSIFPEDVGWKITFIAFAGLTLVSAGLAWKNVPETKPIQRPVKSKPILSKPFVKLLAVVFITAIPEAMLSPIYLIYLQDKFTTDITTIAWAFFPAGLITAFLAARLGKISDRFGRVPMMALGLAGSGIISLLMPSLPSILWLGVVYTLNSVLWGLSEPAETALVADFTDGDRMGMGYGIYDFVENIGFAIGPLLGGLLYDLIGRAMPFYLNGIILILSAGFIYLFLHHASATQNNMPPSE